MNICPLKFLGYSLMTCLFKVNVVVTDVHVSVCMHVPCSLSIITMVLPGAYEPSEVHCFVHFAIVYSTLQSYIVV